VQWLYDRIRGKRSKSMKVITLWQPWATWVILGWKTIETRTHNRFKCLAGQTIGIHAAKKYDANASSWATPWMSDDEMLWYTRLDYSEGVLLGTVDVVCAGKLSGVDSWNAMIDCNESTYARYGLRLRNPVIFNIPIPVKGKQGIWTYEIEGKLCKKSH